MARRKNVHFMGIAGSGMSAAALIAQAQGYRVSGCDLEPEGYYSQPLKKHKIEIALGHSQEHLMDIDILVVSPAILEVTPHYPELIEAKKRKMVMTWQEFMGKYLQKDKFVIAVAGTHGKSTTTAMVGLVLEAAGLDPTVEVGALVPQWQSNARVGKSRYFVCEADEYHHNFLHYSPSIAIINNIDMDHPEFFKDFESFLAAFEKFIRKLVKPKILIVNLDDAGVRSLLEKNKHYLIKKRVPVIGYRLGAEYKFPLENEYRAEIKELGQDSSLFAVSLKSGFEQKAEIKELFRLKLAAPHQIANSLGVIAVARCLNVNLDRVHQVFRTFEGIGRRQELLGEARGVKVIDDYGHHPTAITAVIKATRQKFPKARIWAVFEPHQFSRVKVFQEAFNKALNLADKVIVTKIFPGREKPLPEVSGELLIKKINSSKAKYEENFETVAEIVVQGARQEDVVLVFGAGKSYQLSRMILEKLRTR